MIEQEVVKWREKNEFSKIGLSYFCYNCCQAVTIHQTRFSFFCFLTYRSHEDKRDDIWENIMLSLLFFKLLWQHLSHQNMLQRQVAIWLKSVEKPTPVFSLVISQMDAQLLSGKDSTGGIQSQHFFQWAMEANKQQRGCLIQSGRK